MNKHTATSKLFIAALLVSISFLSFIGGMVTLEFKTWPFSLFQEAYQAAKAWQERLTPRSRYDGTNLFLKARYLKSGILRYNKEKAYNGFTLFASAHAQKAFLISMEGQIVHEWHLPFSKIWENPPHIEFPVPEKFIYWGKVYLYPNGDILVIIAGFGDTPYGYGLVKMDKDSNLVWKYAGRVHHDVDVDSAGNIYTLTHEFTTEKIPGIKLEPPFLEDSIVVLNPNGQELQKLSISKAFYNSNFSSVLALLGDNNKPWDPWHTNNVDWLDEQMAKAFPFLEKGQILISMRQIDTIAAVDLKKEQVVWAVQGPWHRQHDPDFLANGNMLIFDNLGYYGKGESSRIIEFNPKTMEIIWQYTGDEQNPFFSDSGASQQLLPNGNILITETLKGRIFEVTPNKEIVWEFSSPFRAPYDNQLVAKLNSWAQRFHPDDLNFEFSNLNQD